MDKAYIINDINTQLLTKLYQRPIINKASHHNYTFDVHTDEVTQNDTYKITVTITGPDNAWYEITTTINLSEETLDSELAYVVHKVVDYLISIPW